MKNARVKGLLTGAVVFVMMFACTIIAHAASGSVTFGSSSYSVKAGDEFNIGVYVKSDVNVAAYTFNITYDNAKLEYISGADGGGNGTLSFAGYPNGNYKKYWLTFRAKESGSCTIAVTNPYLGPTDAAHGDSLTISTAGSAPITITGGSSGGGTVTGGSADLKSIWIEETGFYGFSASKTEYDITVENELEKVTVTAKAADENATVTISDTNLKVGNNYIYITVTGQDGTTKKYTIIVRRKKADTTEPVTTPSETTTPEPVTTPPETTTPDQTVTPPDVSGESLFTYNDIPLYFCESFDGVDIPEGYTQTGITINESHHAEALVDESGTRILLYLSEASGKSGRLYVYSSSKDRIYPYIEIKNSGHTYVIDEIDAVATIPAGYEKVDIAIKDGEDEIPISALYNSKAEGFYLIYASCDGGSSVLYQYDNMENTIQRFNNLTASSDSTKTDTEEVNKLKAEIEELKVRNKSEMKIWLVIVIILSIFCVLLLTAVFFMYNRMREQMEYARYDEEDMDYYEEDDTYEEDGIADNKAAYSEEEYDFGENEDVEEEIDDNDFTFL